MTHHLPIPARPSPCPPARAVAGLGFLALAATGLLLADTALPAPPRDPDLWAAWYARLGPATAVAALARGIALLGIGYVAALGLLGVVLRLDPRGRRLADRLPAWVGRRLLERVLGVGVATGLGVSLTPLAAAADPTDPPVVDEAAPTTPDTVLMVPIDEDTSETAPPATVDGPSAARREGADDATPPGRDRSDDDPGEAVATMVAVDATVEDPSSDPPTTTPAADPPTTTPAADPPTTTPASAPPVATAPTSDAPAPTAPTVDDVAPARGAGGSWRVELGDHLWSIAAETVQDAGMPSDDEDVLAYWVRLLEANRERLIDPQNPDLLYPGQVLDLPEVSVGSG